MASPVKKYKLGVVEWGLPEVGPYAIELAKHYGLTHIQLNFTRDFEVNKYIERIVAASSQAQVEVSGIALNLLNEYHLSKKHAEMNNQSHSIFIAALKSAISIGTKHIFIPSFYTGKLSTHNDIVNLSTYFRWACQLALKHQITVSTENALEADKARELHKLVGMSNFKIIYDPYNYNINNINPIEIYKDLGTLFHRHVHIKNGSYSKGGIEELQHGTMDIKVLFPYLHRNSIIFMENKYNILGEQSLFSDISYLKDIFSSELY